MSQRTNDEELEDRSSGPSIYFSNNEPNELINTTRGSLGAMSFNNDQEADKLNSRLKHERNVLNEIVRILLAASIVQHPNQRNEAAIKFLIRVDRDNLKPFETIEKNNIIISTRDERLIKYWLIDIRYNNGYNPKK